MTDDRKPLPAEAEMVLVPREPTAAMIEAMRLPGSDDPDHEASSMGHQWVREAMYAAALTAAPKSTQAPGLREALKPFAELADQLNAESLRRTGRPLRAADYDVHIGGSANRVFISATALMNARAALSATPQPVAVPDDGAGRDEVVAWAGKHSSGVAMVTSALSKVLVWRRNGWEIEPLVPASALSAERAARTSAEALAETHREARERHRGERDAERAEVARLRKALEEAEGVLGRSYEGWMNVIELAIIQPQHVTSAGILRDECYAARAAARSSREEGK